MYGDAGGGNSEFRVIPTDGRKHDPKKAIEATYMGYTIGHWEGDTLVLDSISFVDTTWLARGGSFHSEQMRVVERLTRRGNQIWGATRPAERVNRVTASFFPTRPHLRARGGPG
jgi:hypothetical protein